MFFSFLNRFSSFHYLNATQFLGALNDNIYKLLVVYFLIQIQGIEFSHQILATTGAIFVIPFLLFSSVSGVMADRFSKRNIIVMTKILEVLIMLLGLSAFIFKSIEGSYLVLFLAALQSAIFSPSKYGIVPELVSINQISKANGLLTSFTYLAIIIGSCSASFITQITEKNFVLASIFCIIIALVGVLTSLCIEYTPSAGSKKAFQWFFLQEIYYAIKLARQHISLFSSMLGAAYFLFIATFIQLNTIPFAVETLHLTDVQGGYLFFFPALGIGLGALIAGRLSGRIIELGLVPIGAFGGAFFVFLLSLGVPSLIAVISFLIFFGICGGIYEVPLDAYTQISSPIQSRGQIVATSNFLSFIASLLASGAIYINAEFLNLNAKGNFVMLGFLTLGVAIAFTFKFFDYFIRLIASLLSRFYKKIHVVGEDNIPNTPVIYVCTQLAWRGMILLLGSQKYRIQFFIESNSSSPSRWMKKIYHLLGFSFIPAFTSLENHHLMMIQNYLKKNMSICFFLKDAKSYEVIRKLQNFVDHSPTPLPHYPFILVQVEEEFKKSSSKLVQFFIPGLAKQRTPISIAFDTLIS